MGGPWEREIYPGVYLGKMYALPGTEVGPPRQPITSVPPATSVTVSQSRQSLPPRQIQSANHGSPFRHVSDRRHARHVIHHMRPLHIRE